MNLNQFLYQLHYDVENLSPPGWEVDWMDAPLPYKLYQDVPAFSLPLEVPLSLEKVEAPAHPDLFTIGHCLWYTFAVAKVSQTLDPFEQITEPYQSLRRFVPSGGGLYPSELYIYLKLPDLPVGVYHYDSAHHRLLLLRKGNFDSFLKGALGHRCTISSCFATVIVTTMFWKNYFKYNNFSYRLQGLDGGVLIGQLVEVSKRFGFDSGVYFHFIDDAVNHLLGISEQEESVYAVIPLSVKPMNWKAHEHAGLTSSDLCKQIPVIQRKHTVRSKRIKKYPILLGMTEASKIHSSTGTHLYKMKSKPAEEASGWKLPYVEPLTYDLAAACRRRFSPEMDFVLGKVSVTQLASLLQETASSLCCRNDLRSCEAPLNLYCCLFNVESIPDGCYVYDSKSHSLHLIRQGDYRTYLQYAMTMDNVNLHHIPVCIHIVGDSDFYLNSYGYRGYRIQQMEAGMLVQKLLLTAAAFGMNGHPLLGFDASKCDNLYDLQSKGKTCLIQIPIGYYNNPPKLSGALHI